MIQETIIPELNKFSKNQQKKQVTIAYLILVHRFPEQFKRMLKAIYNPNNCYFFRYILQELKYNRISIAWLDKRDNQEMKKHLSDSQYNIEYLNALI